MSRLTLRLPETLHRQLEALARNEEVSLNQYIVYALTRQVTQEYSIQTIPERRIAEERLAYTALLQSLGQASFDEIQRTLDARAETPPEEGLTPEVLQALKRRIAASPK